MKSNIETIVIPTGNYEADQIRFASAVEYGQNLISQGKNVRYLISGIGPDLNEALHTKDTSSRAYEIGEQRPIYGSEDLDIHRGLWNLAILRELLPKPFGIDTLSLNSLDNILNSFPEGTTGSYTIVSRKGHNIKFKSIEKWARKKGLLSSDLRLSYLDTNENISPKSLAYDILAYGKEILRQMKSK